MTHDYKRNGATTLFAALNILDGTVIGRCMRRHRHQEFIRFLNGVERAVPAGKIIHAIVDNYAAHKQPNVLKWIADHPRWTFHFTPTSASWLNPVEGFFSAISRRRIRRGAFTSVGDLQNAIDRYIDAHLCPAVGVEGCPKLTSRKLVVLSALTCLSGSLGERADGKVLASPLASQPSSSKIGYNSRSQLFQLKSAPRLVKKIQ